MYVLQRIKAGMGQNVGTEQRLTQRIYQKLSVKRLVFIEE